MDRLHDLGWSRFTHSCAGMGVCFWNLNGKTAPQGAVPLVLAVKRVIIFFGLACWYQANLTKLPA